MESQLCLNLGTLPRLICGFELKMESYAFVIKWNICSIENYLVYSKFLNFNWANEMLFSKHCTLVL